MRYRTDLRSLFFGVLTLSLLVLGVAGWIPKGWGMVWIAAQTFFCFICNVINHNHTHLGIFRSDRMNRLFSLVLTLLRGHSSLGVVTPHVRNHHPFVGNDLDWSRPGLAGSRIGWGGVWVARYLFRASKEMATKRKLPSTPAIPAVEKTWGRVERGLITLVHLLGINFFGFHYLWFALIPWFLSAQMLLFVNFIQHDGCDPNQELKQSRDFLNPIENWFFLNNGFHTAHHRQPRLHWSHLPTADRAGAINSGSILLYAMKNYFFQFKIERKTPFFGLSRERVSL